jgi:cobalt-zinc-cadmium efflux system protein
MIAHRNDLLTDSHGQRHDHNVSGGERRVGAALLLIGSFMAIEIVGGILAGSLALLADAAHMLTDAVALGLAWVAIHLSGRPADPVRTYGFGRFQVLAAFSNGLGLLFLCVWIVTEVVSRVLQPQLVLGLPMLLVAVAGLAVNIAAFLILHGADRANINIRGASLHVLGDLLGSLAALVAAVVILWTGWMPIDPLLSLAVAALIARNAWKLVGEAGHILLEGAPRDLDVREIGPDLVSSIPGVTDVHHLHAWLLTDEKPILSLHVRLSASADSDLTTARIKERLADRFGIRHSTVQVETGRCRDEPNTLTG